MAMSRGQIMLNSIETLSKLPRYQMYHDFYMKLCAKADINGNLIKQFNGRLYAINFDDICSITGFNKILAKDCMLALQKFHVIEFNKNGVLHVNNGNAESKDVALWF